MLCLFICIISISICIFHFGLWCCWFGLCFFFRFFFSSLAGWAELAILQSNLFLWRPLCAHYKGLYDQITDKFTPFVCVCVCDSQRRRRCCSCYFVVKYIFCCIFSAVNSLSCMATPSRWARPYYKHRRLHFNAAVCCARCGGGFNV